MRWYKFSIVLTIGLSLELSIAILSCLLIRMNGEWLASLVLPYFAPKNPLFYGSMMEIIYLSSAASLGFYVKSSCDLPKGLCLTAAEGSMHLLSLLFFFKFTYEITSFFLATATMLFSVFITYVFLEKSAAAGFSRIPVLGLTIYFWTVLYCLLMINFA